MGATANILRGSAPGASEGPESFDVRWVGLGAGDAENILGRMAQSLFKGFLEFEGVIADLHEIENAGANEASSSPKLCRRSSSVESLGGTLLGKYR